MQFLSFVITPPCCKASITAFNNAMKEWPHIALFSSHDHEFTQTVANRIIEITPAGILDKRMSYDDYINDKAIREIREKMYGGVAIGG